MYTNSTTNSTETGVCVRDQHINFIWRQNIGQQLISYHTISSSTRRFLTSFQTLNKWDGLCVCVATLTQDSNEALVIKEDPQTEAHDQPPENL